MKKLTGKRGKTTADLDQLAKLEFIGGLYVNTELGVHLPAEVIESALNGGARKFKEGQQARSGMYIINPSKLIFDGPQEPEEMFADGRFTFQKMVVVQRSRILRTRPIFENWSADVTVSYENSVVDLEQIQKWFVPASQIVGFCDWRPRYGRFEFEMIT